MTQYLSPLVSCLVCREVKSAKGLFTHYNISHTEEGKQKHHIRSRNGSQLGTQKFKENCVDRRVKSEIEYNENPKKCGFCQQVLDFKRRFNRFCSHSCSAQKSNTERDYSPIKRRTKPSQCNIRVKHCRYCGAEYVFSKENKIVTPSFCSSSCSKEYKRISTREMAIKRNFGGVRPSKRILYKGVSLGSTFELQLALLLDELCIRWVQPKRIKYTRPDGIRSTYTADFYLPEHDIFLDPKNDFLIHNTNPGNKIKDIDKIAFVVEQNHITVCVIDQKNITEGFVKRLVGQEGFEPSLILSCKDSGFDHSHHCPIIYF